MAVARQFGFIVIKGTRRDYTVTCDWCERPNVRTLARHVSTKAAAMTHARQHNNKAHLSSLTISDETTRG